MARAGQLGQGEWVGQIATRGGGSVVLDQLPGQSLEMSRVVDSVSPASLSIERGCVKGIGDVNEYEHELHLRRDGALAWAGPLLEPSYTTKTTQLPARDLLHWFERRRLRSEHDFVGLGADLSTIFQALVDDALSLDTSPNIALSASATGVTDDGFYVPADSFLIAMDRMRPLLRSGLDITALGRTIIVGGEEVPAAPLATLSDDHFTAYTVAAHGLDYASAVGVTGHGGGQNGWAYFATAGGVSTARGLVDRVFNEPDLSDDSALQSSADGHLSMLSATPLYVTGTLAPEAPIEFGQLIPGARVRLVLNDTDRPLDMSARLQSVKATVQAGVEAVSVSFIPLGATL